MIETLPERPPRAALDLPGEVYSRFIEFRANVVGQSQIVWGEHCSECAYPTCYAHCAFYTPRSDFHCRRFVAGIEPLDGDHRLNRIRFRKWGKLEGQGPAALLPVGKAESLSRLDFRASAVIAAIPAPMALKRRAALRWNRRKAAATAPMGAGAAEDFVVEHWGAGGRSDAFTLTFLPLAHGGSEDIKLFQTHFVVSSAYGRLVVPVAEIAAKIDLQRPFLCQIEPIGEAEGVDVVFGVCDFVATADTSLHAEAFFVGNARGDNNAKVVVWDLDETLWTGVLAEDGVDGVRLRPEAETAVRRLDERGVLQTIASKNHVEEAQMALRHFGLHEYFLHPQIHFGPKSGSVAAQAKAFDLGLDSFVFIDDQPFERAEVQSVHPQVRILTHKDVASILDHPWFNLPATQESRRRRSLYLQESQRMVVSEGAGQDYRAFLKTSNIELSIDPLSATDVERIYELSQRTNQLNFTGRKYSLKTVSDLLTPKEGEDGLVLRCRDRFGDYGLIGFVVLDAKQGLVSDLFLSCRVQRKTVEHALIGWLGQQTAEHGGELLKVVYRPSGRNSAALDLLTSLSFRPRDESSMVWERRATAPLDDSKIVAVLARASEPVA